MNEEKLRTFYLRMSNLCARKEYCEGEIRMKLKETELSSNEIDSLIKHLTSEGYIDHSRYCKSFVHDKFTFLHWGKVKLRATLKQKNIEAVIIEESLNNISDEEYYSTIKKLFDKSSPKRVDTLEAKEKHKIYRKLLSKGFEYELIKRALSDSDLTE